MASGCLYSLDFIAFISNYKQLKYCKCSFIMSIALKDTLNLPETSFPMRASLVEREPQRVEHWKKDKLYYKIQEKNKEKPKFILHDGPPFTNGNAHIGTALNKILKDTVLRYKTMQGFSTPYIPGWDCHGLPIEHKVSTELRKEKKELNIVDLRKACEAFSRKWIDIQRKEFTRLGVLADWEREYKTLNPEYEAEILRTFATFVEKDLVYRSKKPVYWSIPCQTALAEAEIEYKLHVSPSIWVKFPVPDASKLAISEPLEVVIWTTTPWTLPSNLAIAVHPQIDYQIVHHQGKALLVAKELAEKFIQTCKLEGAKLGEVYKGKDLEGLKAQHPFIQRESPIVLAEYVTTESGTGCVHTAPGHGPDDYLTAQKYGLEVYSPIDDKGCYEDDGRIPASLVGISVLEKKGKCPANDAVLALLKEAGALLHIEKLEHQYPHCWRSKTPVIFRAMDQWFVGIDKKDYRLKAIESLKKVKWIPDWGEKRIRGALESRPDWCISRQRSWGVPIPVFYDEDGNPLLDSNVIRSIADRVQVDGTNLWFESSAEELLKDLKLPEAFVGKTLVKGSDTLDVWIDSGTSHQAVLKRYGDLKWPADLYFEGSDQHRGWFQSSLWTSIILEDQPPYNQVITHGFVVDEQKKKISKSEGAQTSEAYVNKYGADILRLWVNSEDYRSDIPFSDKIIKQITQTYRTIRNTLRFQLGNLYDFNFHKNAVAVSEMTAIDKWALHKTAILIKEVTEDFDQFLFHKATQKINRFCTVVLSATFHDVLKDRLYTYGPNWKERRSSQTAIYHIFHVLVKILAPILTFTAEEAFAYSQSDEVFGENSIHMQDWPEANPSWLNETAFNEVEAIFAIRDKVNEKLEEARQGKVLGQSLDAKVIITGSDQDENFVLLQKYQNELPEFFIVSQVDLVAKEDKTLDVAIKHADGIRCPRSWRWVPNLEHVENFGEVSPRCRDALLEKYEKNPITYKESVMSPKKKTTKKTAQKKTQKTVLSKTTKPKMSKKSESSKAKKPTSKTQEETPAQKKEALLGARKRKGTPSIFKIRSRKTTPVIFTLEDVKDIIKTKKEPSEEKKEEKPSVPQKAKVKQRKVKQGTKQKKQVLGAASLTDILGFNPKDKKAKPRQQIDESKIEKKFMPYYRALLKLRESVKEGLDFHAQDTLKRSSKDDTGDLSSYSQHMADVGTDTFDRDFALSLLSNEQDALFEIEEAIQRIVDGSYGVCEITGKPIARERLRAVPFTRYSLEGQKQLEESRHVTKERGGVFAESSLEESAKYSNQEESEE